MQSFWLILAGLAFMLFSMELLEDFFGGLAKYMDKLMKKFTNTKIGSIVTGYIVTFVLQSSNITSLLVLALVGSGVLGLSQAVGVILGANIGTTTFDGLVAFFGIANKGFDFATFTLPMIALGGIGMLFVKKWKHRFGVLFALGLMFYSIDILKLGVSGIKETIDLTQIIGLNPWIVFGFGILMTLIIQSSGALILISLAAMSQGVIGFEEGLAIAIGSYIGATVTIVVGSIRGSRSKKQVALGHALFNIFWSTVAMILFGWISAFLLDIVGMGSIIGLDTASGDDVYLAYVKLIALFHMFFKLICVAITYPFYNKFLQIILYFIPDKQDITRLHIDDWSPKLGNGIKVDLIEQDINTLQKLAWEFIGQTIREPEELSSERYETIKKIGSKIILAINGLDEMILNTKGLSIDSVQHDMSAIKDIKDIAHNIVSLKLSDKKAISDYYSYMLEQFEQFRSGNLIDPKDALHQLKIYDNQIISSGALDLEDISLVGNVHFNFYHAMKNLVE